MYGSLAGLMLDVKEDLKTGQDGVRDVEAMGSQELVQHKAMVFMQSPVLSHQLVSSWEVEHDMLENAVLFM